MPLVPIGIGKAELATRSQETTLVRATLSSPRGRARGTAHYATVRSDQT